MTDSDGQQVTHTVCHWLVGQGGWGLEVSEGPNQRFVCATVPSPSMASWGRYTHRALASRGLYTSCSGEVGGGGGHGVVEGHRGDVGGGVAGDVNGVGDRARYGAGDVDGVGARDGAGDVDGDEAGDGAGDVDGDGARSAARDEREDVEGGRKW